MTKQPAIFIAGHRGMVGSAIVRRLESSARLLTASRQELDLLRQAEVEQFFAEHAIDQVYLAAAKVGGIHANDSYPADFLYQNLQIQANIIDAAYRAGVGRLLFLGSSCIYPKLADQPMREDALLTGPLEPTNEAYAIAKIAGIKLCESYNRQYGTDFRSVMPTNLYGPGDNYHLQNSHVVPALLRKFHQAKLDAAESVPVWGSGRPRREFLHVDDMAEASCFMMNLPEEDFWSAVDPRCSHVNIGVGKDCTIRELAETIQRVTGFEGRLEFDPQQPDGTPRKLLDVSLARRLGWSARINLERGLADAYDWMCQHWQEISA